VKGVIALPLNTTVTEFRNEFASNIYFEMWISPPFYKEQLDPLIQLRSLFPACEIGGFHEGENPIVDFRVMTTSGLVGGCRNSGEYTAFIFRMEINSLPITLQSVCSKLL
jgi:hypothetical protein